ncbi:MAG: methionine synthase [Armatimonadota bacterium]
MSFLPKCMATAIGSLPHADADDAINIILNSIPDAPMWPQLPANGMNEQMEIQYSEGLPDVVVDNEKQRIYFDTTDDTFMALGAFMEKIAMDDVDAFAISPEYSKGIYALEQTLKASGSSRPFVKVQTTGPLSFGLTIVDQDKRAIYYNDVYKDAVIKALAMKCRWQIRKFKPYAEKVICFIDEPILSAFGSSTYVSVSREDVISTLSEVIEAVHSEGALAGIHCCGNTEWSILIDAGVDIISFDAFDFGDTIALYADSVKKYLEAGKYLAWGIVPTNSEKVRGQSVESLIAKFNSAVDNLAAKSGLDRNYIIDRAFITPSCGTGSLPVDDAELVFRLLSETSRTLQGR